MLNVWGLRSGYWGGERDEEQLEDGTEGREDEKKGEQEDEEAEEP